ncbi:hypothetical protein M2475_000795 [Breznakia sp. PF5-3]|uniref:hypothetical protein n=1 Tax=unclassified Breznakia TaxID=2623764 RepID=UPI002406E2BD|nr:MULTISPECIES: hypothetical protein [unclassified Breznakia]MDF9824487.1 hypothetical protein [Breznakia sp. PM6-1]MDF9835230.1 hypothetical protein [Breznakia sp. PF5-3]MDF9837442.1 hypothetical protein [Breznakia sp. PFB2-8]MDF9859378.1 hypothetical protein [Breznakia sp. PH5-24]
MELKCLYIDSNNNELVQVRDLVKNDFGDFQVVEIYDYDNQFFVFRITRLDDAVVKYGVPINDDIVGIEEKIGAKSAYICDFFILDYIKCDGFYTGSKKNIAIILKYYFNIKDKMIKSLVSVDDFMEVTKLRVTKYKGTNKNQIQLFEKREEEPLPIKVQEIFSELVRDKEEHVYYFREKKFGRHKDLESFLLSTRDNPLVKYSFDGIDKNGKAIAYQDGFFAKKIEIFSADSYKDYTTRKELSLVHLVMELKKNI